MEAGSLDDDYDDECVDFMDLVVFCVILSGFVWISWIPGARGRATCGNRIKPDYTGVVPQLELCNLGTSILMTEPGGLQAWRLAAWMVILHPAAGRMTR